MKIAVFGGSFNPPHVGHLLVCQYVLATKDIDRVWMMPANEHPLEKPLIDFWHRHEMCRRMCANSKYITVCAHEKILGGKSYTIRLLEALTENYPNDEFSFVVGSDAVEDPDNWLRFNEIKELAHLIVISRDLITPNVSSSMIREKLNNNEGVDEYLPRSVLEYIENKNLYGGRK